MKHTLAILALFSLLAFDASGQAAGLRGPTEAVLAARQLVDHAGGVGPWSKRTLRVTQRAFLRSGEVAQMSVARDFESGARRFESNAPSRRVLEWVSPALGWVVRNGERREMAHEELAIELQGLNQEPYSIYHRIALNDPDLRFDLRDDGRLLVVYDRAERVLCWFQRDAAGHVTGWGNAFDGAITQHYYGPTEDKGDVNLPRWGISSDGGYRFEYLSAVVSDTELSAPD